jgi:hypothetical protein
MLERTDRSSSNLPPGRYTLLDKTPAREVRNDFVNRTDDLDDFPALTSRNQAVEDHLSQTCKVSTDIPRPYQILCGHRVLRYVGASTKPANSVPTSRIKSSRALGLWIKLANSVPTSLAQANPGEKKTAPNPVLQEKSCYCLRC